MWAAEEHLRCPFPVERQHAWRGGADAPLETNNVKRRPGKVPVTPPRGLGEVSEADAVVDEAPEFARRQETIGEPGVGEDRPERLPRPA